MSFVGEIKKVTHGDAATGGIYIGMLGLFLSDIIPTPADGVYFWYERKIRLQLENKEITPSEYWRREASAYYFFNAAWWIFVIIITASIKGGPAKKLKVLFVLLGTGIVLGIIANNIKKDKELYGNLPKPPDKPPTKIM